RETEDRGQRRAQLVAGAREHLAPVELVATRAVIVAVDRLKVLREGARVAGEVVSPLGDLALEHAGAAARDRPAPPGTGDQGGDRAERGRDPECRPLPPGRLYHERLAHLGPPGRTAARGARDGDVGAGVEVAEIPERLRPRL